jgi:serine/threonine protein kinase/Tol biopolymer transport system component
MAVCPEQEQRIKALLQSALELDPTERASFLDRACAGDLPLRQEVESLIAAQEQATGSVSSSQLGEGTSHSRGEDLTAIIGRPIAHYKVLSFLGRGGMGEVYLAQDARLGRKVALKLLPASLSNDEDRLRRFEREARSASALNHPNVCVIYEVGETDDGRHFIAMERIDGITLRRRFAQGPLKLTEAIDIAVQTASALAAAHRAGVVHRDIKPENIMLRRDGYVKVLDFGLAKLTERYALASDSEAPTFHVFSTHSGLLIGTANYLSPEQARRQEVDERSDIWSLGVVLYEMLTGSMPFTGETPSHAIVAILESEPMPLTQFLPDVPAELEWIVKKALRKDREQRYQTVKEMLGDLNEVKQRLTDSAAGRGQQSTGRVQTPPVTHSSAFESISETLRRPRISIGVFALAVLMIGAIAWAIFHWTRSNPSEAFQNIRMTKITSTGKTVDACISPDGNYLADVIDEGGKQSLWLRQLDVPAAGKQIVPPTESQYEGLTFSRDGKYVYYVVWENNARDVLYRVAVLGDSPKKLSTEVDSPVGFSPDGQHLSFIRRRINQGETAVIIANSDGTEERTLAKRKEPSFFVAFAPAWSPDGKVIAVPVRSSAGGFHSSVAQLRLSDGVETPVSSKTWALVEKVIWLKDNRGLIITAADQTSSPFQIWHISYPDGVARRITTDLNTYVGLSLSEDFSKLLTVQSERLSSISVAAGSDTSQAAQITSGASQYYGVAWTPDGRIVFGSVTNGNPDIWIMDAKGGSQKQLTSNSSVERDPTVSPDGRYILFSSNQAGRFNVWRMDINGDNPKQLTNGDDEEFPQCSPDGKWVVYQGFSNGIPTLWRASIDGSNPIQLTYKYSNWPAISPDGKLIACSYLGEAGGKWRLTTIPSEGGAPQSSFDMPIPYLQHFAWQRIRWTVDGKGIAYINNREGISNIWSQPVAGGPPQKLTDFKSDQIFNFAWSPNGRGLAYLRGIVRSDVVLITEGK